MLLVAELLAVAAVVAAAVFAMFWASALGERNDALDALEVAVAERDQAIGVAAQAAADLATTEADLTTATADIERLQGELDARTADLAALRAEVSDLTGQVDELTIANADLTASVEQLEAERTAPAPAAESPELVRFVGELVTSVSGPSALTADQQRCIGSGVIAALGLDSVATTVIASATPEAELAVALTTGEAADACGIDRALIFG